METKLTPLGTAGWMPTDHRETMCWLLEYRGSALIFDLGSGLRRLAGESFRHLLAPYREICVFLSHFHLDHVAAIPYLPPVFGARRIRMFAPGWRVTGFSAREALGRLTSRPLFSLPFDRIGLDLELVELDEGRHTVGEFTVSLRRQQHSDPSVAYRIDDVFTYATDTCCDDETIGFAQGSRWLVHECWLDHADYNEKLAQGHPDTKSHSHIDGVIEIAQRAQVSALILGHLNPTYSEERLREMAEYAATKFPSIHLLNDGESLT